MTTENSTRRIFPKAFGIGTPKGLIPAIFYRNESKGNHDPGEERTLSRSNSGIKDDHRDGSSSSVINPKFRGDRGRRGDQPPTSNSESRSDHNNGEEQWLLTEDPSPETPSQTINVVLFGETGVGKSSVINLIARKDIAKVSSDVNGCTMQSHRYDIPFDNMDFAIFDTIGLEEPQMGVNGYLKAIEKAYELISKLSTAGGIHLLLFCMRGGRITATTQSNYRLFCECLCDTKVPIALVFTGLEREDRMENWWDRNRSHIEHYGIKSQGHACITAVQDDAPGEEDKYKQSQETIRELLKTCARKGGAYSPESQRWFARLGLQLRSFLPAKKNPKKKDIVKVLTNRCKLDADTARRVAEMMEKGDTENKDASPEEGVNPQQGGTTPQEHDGTTPQPEEGATPQLEEGAISQSEESPTPQPEEGATSQSEEGPTPHQEGVTQQVEQGAIPQPRELQNGVTPRFKDGVTPQPQQGVAQQVKQDVISQPRGPQEGVTPRHEDGITPQPQRGVVQQVKQGANPQPREPQEGVTSQSKESATTRPKEGMTPQPKEGVARPSKQDAALRPGEHQEGMTSQPKECPTTRHKEGVAQPLEQRAIVQSREHQEGVTPRPKESVTQQGVAQRLKQDAIPRHREGMTIQQEGGAPQSKQGEDGEDGEDGSTVYEETNEGPSEEDNKISDATPEKRPSATRVKPGSSQPRSR